MPTGLSSTSQPCDVALVALRAGRRRALAAARRSPACVASRSSSSVVVLVRGRAGPRGVRSSFSIRSASSNRSSMRKRMSGANFRLTRCAISPRRNCLLRSSAASTSLRVRAAERHDVDRSRAEVGRHAHFRHRDHVALEHRIMHLAARQHLGERMAHELADAQRRCEGPAVSRW